MTVGDNVGYGLMVRKVAQGASAHARVAEALRMVRLEGYDARKPSQLSGGQRQRVALARALVNRPRVLLLDEPLGALDLKLREEMQIELKAIQQQVGITFIYVTHDQEEALTMSDRMAVFNARPDRAARHAGGCLRAAGDAVRRRLRRDVQPAHAATPRERSSGATGRSPSGPRRSGSPSRTRRSPDRRDRGRRPRSATSSTSAPTPATSSSSTPGAQLVVTQQNLATTSTEALAQQGKAVRLIWKRQHELPVADGEGSSEEEKIVMKHRRLLALAGGGGARRRGVYWRRRRLAGPERAGVARRGRGRAQPRSSGPATPSAARPIPAYDWVTPFETKTGCKVNTIDMTDSNNGVSLMQSGDYDGGSFSGDATQRLMAGGIVAPVNTALSRTTRTSSRASRTSPTTRSTACRTASRTVAARTCSMYNTDVVHDGADIMGSRLERRRGRRAARSASTTRRSSSPTRPCT